MQIQIHTDRNIEADAQLIETVETAMAAALGGFGSRLTRVEVHLSDENGPVKSHGEPMRCRLETRPASRQPVLVTADAATVEQAVAAAAKKMERLLDSTFGKLDDPRG
ncbi:MAG: HPF/RaiA family ribosome-associated protein [Fimbriiglobus sp.]|jgi:hypothetical protein|nr:HPF/RaiA family ribosome-associated protein [Fimbriiglobus sp.]